MLLLWLCLLLQINSITSQEVYVSSETGQDVAGCGSDETNPCRTISYQGLSKDITNIYLLNGTYSGVGNEGLNIPTDANLTISPYQGHISMYIYLTNNISFLVY